MQKLKSLSLFVLFIITVILASCGSDKKEPEKNTAEKSAPGTLDADTSKLKPEEIKTDPISLRNTAFLVSEMLRRKPLEKLARKSALGGYFLSDVFKIQAPNKGVILWHCYNPGGKNSLPELFVAVEQVAAYDSTRPPEVPVAARLAVPLDTFKYKERGNQHAVILSSLRNQRTKPNGTSVRTTYIAKDSVVLYNDKFEELMMALELATDSLYCKYSHAFFIENNAYRKFLQRNPVYVRYYFGLSWDATHKPNYFRPILAGADAEGGTINKNAVKVEGPFLQKSVPPPPIE